MDGKTEGLYYLVINNMDVLTSQFRMIKKRVQG